MSATSRSPQDTVVPLIRGQAKRAARTLHQSRVGRSFWRAAYRNVYRWEPADSIRGRAVDLTMSYEVLTKRERQASVRSLADLFHDLIDVLDIRLFVEAGAKDGAASRRVARRHNPPAVVAFEANPYTYRRFAPRFHDLPVQYEHLALSDRVGETTFLVRLTEERRPHADGQASFLRRADHTHGYEEVTLSAVTLDSYFEASLGERTALWIDVEGATAIVLRGAERVLETTDLVMIEVERRAIWTDQEWVSRDVYAYFRQAGLHPIARDRQSRNQFNVVFVRPARPQATQVDAELTRWFDLLDD